MTVATTLFDIKHPNLSGVMTAAEAALTHALDIQPGERILIMANPDEDIPLIGQAVYNAAIGLKAAPVLLYQSARSRLELAEPSIIAAMVTKLPPF